MKRVRTLGNTKDLNLTTDVSNVTNRTKLGGGAESKNKAVDQSQPAMITRRAALGDIGNKVANRTLPANSAANNKKPPIDLDLKKRDSVLVAVQKVEPRKPLRSGSTNISVSNNNASSKVEVAGAATTKNNSHVTAAAAVMKKTAVTVKQTTVVADVHQRPTILTRLSQRVSSAAHNNHVTGKQQGALVQRSASTRSINTSISEKTKKENVVPNGKYGAGKTTSTSIVEATISRAQSSALSSITENNIVAAKPPIVPAASISEDIVESKKSALAAAAEAYSQAMIPDIDADDALFPQLVSEFVNDIYDYMRYLEKEQAVRKDFLNGQEITARMRGILIDWLVQVHLRFHLLPETMYMTTMLIDRFLQESRITKDQLQLVGVTAMFVASKYEEIYAPEIGDFVFITDSSYTRDQLRRMERMMLKTLDFRIGRPSAIHFLRRYSKAAEADDYKHTMAKYFLELSFVEYSLSHTAPSLVAAAALWLSLKLLGDENWTPTLVYYTKYAESDVMPVVKLLCQVIINVHYKGSKLQAVRNKYSATKFFEISKHESLNHAFIREVVSLT